MLKELGTNRWVLFWIVVITLVAQLPSGFLFYKVLEMQDEIAHYNDILASEVADNTDIEFIAQLKKEAGFSQDIQILIGPYRKLYGNSFKYQLEKHLAFVEQSQTMKETFLIFIDKTFYGELNHEQRKGILAHEIWHIFSLAKRFIKPSNAEEVDADNYAIRYVSVETMTDLCKQYEGDEMTRDIRIKNLERHRLIAKITDAS